MKINELRKIAKKRTPGEWFVQYNNICGYEPFTDGSTGPGELVDIVITDSGIYPPYDDNKNFILSSANHFDALLDIAEAAQTLLKSCCEDERYLHGMLEVESALKKLEET